MKNQSLAELAHSDKNPISMVWGEAPSVSNANLIYTTHSQHLR